MTTVSSPAFLANLIVALASLVAAGSFFAARAGSFATFPRDGFSHRLWICVIIILGLIFILALCMMIFYFSDLGQKGFPMLSCLKNEVHVVYFWAFVSLGLLPFMIWLTDGPTSSWFTSFLLMVVPLMILLDAQHPNILWIVICFFFTIVVYVATAWVQCKWPCGCEIGKSNHGLYQICYGFFVLLAVGFPMLVGIVQLIPTAGTAPPAGVPAVGASGPTVDQAAP